MNTDQIRTVEFCAQGALTGALTFPEIVGKLSQCGIERYHADYSRREITYYLEDGDSQVVSTPHPLDVTGFEFSAADVAAAVQESQRGEHSYLDFIRKTMAAGCVGYFVQITGRRVIYFGRDGDFHIEYFPDAP
ncbi:DUF1398 domain-containing protein [Planctopirus hydrillae]|uniref:DUF1398 domain-containing protein n=1 Tax=Planctopirus hydrillae TaxID=1841610 RepID=A0A1C3EKS2_9PLAN|nr:DUF1398 family protein [Planctopirus hydrillae]ODA33829.1 hypothetical protein A6X21_18095 [Planctopirus hydrillae]